MKPTYTRWMRIVAVALTAKSSIFLILALRNGITVPDATMTALTITWLVAAIFLLMLAHYGDRSLQRLVQSTEHTNKRAPVLPPAETVTHRAEQAPPYKRQSAVVYAGANTPPTATTPTTAENSVDYKGSVQLERGA